MKNFKNNRSKFSTYFVTTLMLLGIPFGGDPNFREVSQIFGLQLKTCIHAKMYYFVLLALVVFGSLTSLILSLLKTCLSLILSLCWNPSALECFPLLLFLDLLLLCRLFFCILALLITVLIDFPIFHLEFDLFLAVLGLELYGEVAVKIMNDNCCINLYKVKAYSICHY